MKKNLGSADRVIRILLAVIIIALFLMNIISGMIGVILIVVSGILLATSLVSFCPLYALLHINSNQKTNLKRTA